MTTSAPTHAPSRRRRSKPTRRHCPPSTSSFHPPPRRTHRAYGLPNANQILLAVVTLGMLCYQLIRSDWIQFDGIDGGAGLLGLQLTGVNDTTISMPWSEYCYTSNHTISLPMDTIPRYTQPINPSLAQSICDSSTVSVVRGLTITCIALSLVSIVIALYLHFGTPSRREMVWWGIVPGISLFSCAIMGTIALQQWQNTFAHVNIGDCFGVAIASVVIAYITSISMVLRWRWPGVCMVPTEQQAFEARTHQVPRIIRETIPPPSTGGGTLYEEPERDRSSFHQIV